MIRPSEKNGYEIGIGGVEMFDDSLYDTTEVCHHRLSVALINKKQILFIPVLRIRNISEAAVIYNYPMEAEEILED